MGDSLFDNGNNNLLVTAAKANYPPYGIDYPHGPTGRFSNGRNIADFLGEFLGFDKPISPFVTAKGSKILKGVNYASGGAGILDDSGSRQGDRFSLNRQLQNHRTTILRLALLLGSMDQVKEHLRKCLYTINIGNNDYLNNYYLPQFYSTSRLYTQQQFADLLIRKYSQQLRTLYNYEARKIAIFGIGLIGCVPSVLAMYPPANGSTCVDSINGAVQLFNNMLKTLVDDLNNELPNAKFIYINITSISSGDPSALGIKVANASCCIVSTTIAKGQCAPGKVPCSNRSEYIFYDDIHPVEIFNELTAARAYNATSPTDSYPIDIRRLLMEMVDVLNRDLAAAKFTYVNTDFKKRSFE
ncbi:GDSL esterase/lipase [Forsythia ovata]|uniref:GDSL esterase/lipase n=1 Tax=Forsythia ovata TaxID=205694 RepID=A0ABD1S2D4_9LAMI